MSSKMVFEAYLTTKLDTSVLLFLISEKGVQFWKQFLAESSTLTTVLNKYCVVPYDVTVPFHFKNKENLSFETVKGL
jgi:hypothetical protein